MYVFSSILLIRYYSLICVQKVVGSFILTVVMLKQKKSKMNYVFRYLCGYYLGNSYSLGHLYVLFVLRDFVI